MNIFDDEGYDWEFHEGLKSNDEGDSAWTWFVYLLAFLTLTFVYLAVR